MGLVKFSIVDKGEVRTDNQGVTTTTLHLVALMASLNENQTALKAALPGYQRFQPHPNSISSIRYTGGSSADLDTELTLYVDEFQATQRPHTAWWDITVTYTNKIVANPLAEAAVIGEMQTFTIPGGTLVDKDNEAILNTAGEPPEPFDKPERVIQIQIIKNVSDVIQSWWFDLEDCVNDDEVTLVDGTVAAARTLLISSVKFSAINDQAGIKYRVCTIEILRRKSTWDTVFPSRGFNQKITQKQYVNNPTTGAWILTPFTGLSPILIDNQAPTEPQFLDEDGKWLKNPAPADIYLITAKLFKEVDFSTFPLT